MNDEAAARRALAAFPIDVRGISFVGHCENSVYRIEAAEGTYAFRVHRRGYHDAAELRSERQWTDALIADGIGAPRGINTRQGGAFSEAEFCGQPHFVSLLEWVEGEIMHESLEPETAVASFTQLGAILARLHNQATSWSIPAGFKRPCVDADGLVGEQPVWGRFWESPLLTRSQTKFLCELRSQIYQRLIDYGQTPDSFSLIHSDLHPGNVVLAGDRLHLIDFDDAAFGWHIADIAVALRHYQKSPHFGDYRDALIAGYRLHRPLADHHLDPLKLFLLIRALNAIGWVADRPRQNDGYHDELIAYVEDLGPKALQATGG